MLANKCSGEKKGKNSVLKNVILSFVNLWRKHPLNGGKDECIIFPAIGSLSSLLYHLKEASIRLLSHFIHSDKIITVMYGPPLLEELLD